MGDTVNPTDKEHLMAPLERTLTDLDGKGYKAYKGLLGEYAFEGWSLVVDHVQADPFAAPSRIRAIVDSRTADLPEGVFRSPARERAPGFHCEGLSQCRQGRKGPGH